MKLYVLIEFQGSDDEDGSVVGMYKTKKEANRAMHRKYARLPKVLWRWHEKWSYTIYEVDL